MFYKLLPLLGLGIGVPGLAFVVWVQVSTDFGTPWTHLGLIILIVAIVHAVYRANQTSFRPDSDGQPKL